jgi:uncharacterized membrane protein
MFYILLTILAAFAQSSRDLLAKKLANKVNPYTLSFGILSIVSVVCLAMVILVYLFPDFFNTELKIDFSYNFVIVFLLTGAMFAISAVLMNKAFQISELSLIIPILNFSPVFTLLLSPFLLSELPNNQAIIGIFLILFGSYILRLDLKKYSLFQPIQSLFNDKGALLMLAVAFIWGLDTILGKIGAGQTNPYFWTFSTRLMTTLLLLPMVIKSDKNWVSSLKENSFNFLIMGGLVAFSIIAQTIAVLKLDAAIVGSLLRFATLSSVFFGWWFLKEKNFLEKISGAIIMIIGVIFISWN